ncbi:MAG: hypothetical protein ACK4TB_18125, partial [Gemmobacter sp.]
PQRPGDEKFQLPALFPPQHRSLSSIDMQIESEAWGFFNSPHRTVSCSLEPRSRQIGRRDGVR